MLRLGDQVSTVTHRSLNGKPAANFEMPIQWLGSSSGGVVVEMAYVSHFRLVRSIAVVPISRIIFFGTAFCESSGILH